jgi:uroporphyrin-III C-methyltransferase
VIGKVKDIVYRSQYAGLTNPAIIIIGEVVNIPAMLSSIAAGTKPGSRYLQNARKS